MTHMPSVLPSASSVHRPGIEPGSHRWQRCILPLDHRCNCTCRCTEVSERWHISRMHDLTENNVFYLSAIDAATRAGLRWHLCIAEVYTCVHARHPRRRCNGPTSLTWPGRLPGWLPGASAGNRTRVTSMATVYSTTRPPMQWHVQMHRGA